MGSGIHIGSGFRYNFVGQAVYYIHLPLVLGRWHPSTLLAFKKSFLHFKFGWQTEVWDITFLEIWQWIHYLGTFDYLLYILATKSSHPMSNHEQFISSSQLSYNANLLCKTAVSCAIISWQSSTFFRTHFASLLLRPCFSANCTINGLLYNKLLMTDIIH